MAASLHPALSACLWLGLGLAVALLSAQLAFAWITRTAASDLHTRLHRLLGAGLSLGTGIWAVQALSAVLGQPGLDVGYEMSVELTVWVLAVAASMAALGRLSSGDMRITHWAPAALVLGCAVLGLQLLGLLAAGLPIETWVWRLVTSAGVLSMTGATLGFWFTQRARRGVRPGVAWSRAGAVASFGAALVGSQHLVALSAGLSANHTQAVEGHLPGWLLAALATLGAGVVLLGLFIMLRQQLRLQSADAKARRALGTKLLNDPLTGLPNRPLFEGTLAQAVRNADVTDRRLALLFINLDGFRPVNESFGHHGGDALLCKVASRLRALSGPHMSARLASDEFLMLMTGNPEIEDASDLAAKVLNSIGRPFTVDGRNASISCSIGVAMYPEHGAMSTLIRHAEAAMRAAKSAGGASHAFFEARMLNGSRDDMALLRDLRMALERGQFELYYQPKIHAPSGEITGAEALVRWNHPKRGMISPGVFIPIAERFGLINELGRWVIDEACRQTRAWRDAGLRMRVAINLSVHQLRQSDLAERIEEALKRHQINPDLITCELTETSAMDDTEGTMRVLRQLDLVGVHISIDDFGTGHSSLAYLRKLPADELKIDRSFVQDLETSEDARKVAFAVINLAKALELKVVAEGVETEGQYHILREYGCDQLQGFLFAKPMSAKALMGWAVEDVGPRTMNFRASLFKSTVQISPVPT